MIVHHASTAPLDHAALVHGNPHGCGPSALGLWTCAALQDWQRSYGPVLNRIAIHPTAEVLRTTSAELCAMAGGPGTEAWSLLSAELLSQCIQAVALVDDADQVVEFVILDPVVVQSIETVDWPA